MAIRSAMVGCLAILLTDAGAHAATFYARTAGAGTVTTNWSQNTTWTADSDCNGAATAGIPGAADDVVMCNGKTVTVNVTTSVRSISLPANGATQTTLQITAGQLSVSQGITAVSGTGNGGNRRILVSGGATLSVDGDVTLNGNNSNDNRHALLGIDGANVSIGGNLLIDGFAGDDRARVTLTNASNLVVGGSITLDLGGLLDNGATQSSVVSVGGNFTHIGVADDYSSTGGEFRFTGTGAQALNGSTTVTTTFYRLTIDKPSGDVTINHVAQIANGGTLALTSGRIVTGTSYVGLGSTAAATLSGGSTNSYVIGNFRRYIPGGTQSGIVFPVGGTTASRYAPVQIDFSNVTTPGQFQVAAATGNTDHPNIATSGLDSAASVNRYWTLTNTGSIAFAGSPGTAVTFNYPTADIDAGADTSSFLAADYTGGAWSYPAMGTLAASSTQVTGLTTATIAGDYIVAELVAPYSYWRMNETSWNGTANEVADLGTGSNPGTATTLTGTRPNTSTTSPAIAGSPGTCGYGTFNRNNKNYLALTTGYPALMASGQPGFTITAWINSTNSTLPGQRILIDDQNDTSPGAWGFSLGETDRAGAGGVRFYYRQATTVTIDTVPVPSNQWLFVALSVSLATGTNASAGTIYVYNTAGTLVTSYSQNFTWTAGSDPGPPSIGGETNASAEGNNAFGFSGNLDELRVYRTPLSQSMVNRVRQLVNPCQIVNHYALSGSFTAVNCEATTVQFTAHDASHNPVAPAAGTTFDLDTSTGTGVWIARTVGTGTWAPTGLNDGQARYTWPGGQTTFSATLRHNTVATVNINVVDANGVVELGTEDLGIAFVNSGFRVTEDGTSSVNIGTQLSGKNSNTGFGQQTLNLQAIRTDTNTGSCVGVFQNQTVTIEMAAARISPTAGGSQVSVRNSAGTMTALGTGGGAAGAYTSVSLAFNAQSMAPLVLNYPNAGSVNLYARYLLPSPPANTYISGTSNTFVVRPFGLRIAGPPSGRTGVSSGNLYAARAGENWPNPVTVTAVAWEAGDDLDNNGVPDSDAVLGNNAVTDNFGVSSTATVSLTHTLAEPSGGNSGTLTTTWAAPVSGQFTSNPTRWSEVGIINLFAASTNYLGSGQNVTNSAVSDGGYAGVGRFAPYDFAVTRNTPEFQRACTTGNFTYVGQTFNYTSLGTRPVLNVTARNLQGVTTQNYTGTFMRLVSGSITPGTQATRYARFDALGGGATPALDLTGLPAVTADPTIGTFTAGVGSLTFSGGTGFTFPRGNPVAPFDADIALTVSLADQDSTAVGSIDGGAATNPVRFGTAAAGAGINFAANAKSMRYGRLRLQSANGSERLPLQLRVEAQYWNGNGFVLNGNDTCTQLSSSNIALGNYRGNLAAGETTASFAPSPVTLVGGATVLRFTAPGPGDNGSVDVSLNLGSAAAGTSCIAGMAASTAASLAWLQGAWCGVTHTRDPSARATFGIYGASDRIIYLRENY